MRSNRSDFIDSRFTFVPILLTAIGGLCLAGCGGIASPSSTSLSFTSPPPTSPPPALVSPTILSPDPSAVSSLPVTIQIGLNGDPLTSIKIDLNGVDITSDFTESNAVATAIIKDGVYVGGNRLSATAGNLPTVGSTFSYTPLPPPGLTAPQPPGSVPIQTHVETANGSGQQTFGVEIGQTIYANPGPVNDWQLLLLSRSNLSMIANHHYTIASLTDSGYGPLNQLISDITPGGSLVKQCGQPGCLMVLQGPPTNAGFSPYPCNAKTTSEATDAKTPSDATECSRLTKALNSIGATATSTFIKHNGASGSSYSFIGNVGNAALSAGVNFERITCPSSNGCLTLPKPIASNSNAEFMNGIAPNGVDGVIPNLADTADPGTTSIPATMDAPAMTVYDNGAMAGLLVADNNSNYTFTYAAPPIRFQMGSAPDSPNKHIVILQLPAASQMRFPGGETTLQEASAQMPPNQVGGFHLVVLNATTLQPLINATYVTNLVNCAGTCPSPDGTTIYSLDRLPAQLQQLPSRGYLWFLGSFGSLSRNFPATISYGMQDLWDRIAQSVQDLGGTYPTFAMLDNPALANDDYDQYTKDHVPTDDDYNMVGQLWINASGVNNPYAAETSRAISRQTSLYPVAGNMQGVLTKGHDGFYRASQHSQYAGVLPVPALDFANASYLPHIPWPLTGPKDPIGPNHAYQFISEQLQQCATCNDIRSAYANLNLTPGLLYSILENLQPPSDCDDSNNPCGFSSQDFATAKTQLLQELFDLKKLDGLQTDLMTAALAQLPDFNSLLTAVGDNVLANIPYTNTIQIGANTTGDVLNVIGDASGFAGLIPTVGAGISAGVRTGIGLYELLSDDGTTANDPNGVSLMQQEQDFATIAKLANQRANQYAQSLTTIGVSFDRIVADWGRMQTAAVPVINNTLQFDAQTLGQYLTGYNLAVRRSLYATLMPLNYYAVHYRYADPGLNHHIFGIEPDWYFNHYFYGPCNASQGLSHLLTDNPESFGFWQGALIDGPGASLNTSAGGNGHLYPLDAWWDAWFVGQRQAYNNTISQEGNLENFPQCPANQAGKYLPPVSLFEAAELFIPLGTDPNALGLYKPWFLGRGSLVHLRAVGTATTFWIDFGRDGEPAVHGSNWAPDPDNY